MSRLRVLKFDPVYDVIIIGGGIYGASLLYETTAAGLKSILLDKADFGSGTSANSLKVIHGGIRYLQQLDLPRIRESIRERKTLMRFAPHLIHPLACVTPTFANLKDHRRLYAAAFGVYDLIGFDRNCGSRPDKYIPRSRIVSHRECLHLIPGLPANACTGAAIWQDGQVVNSERLVLAFISEAQKKGAAAYNYLEVQRPISTNKAVVGVSARDALANREVEIRGRLTVNCAGPWLDAVDKRFGAAPDRKGKYGWAKAVNFIIPRTLSSHAIGMRIPPEDPSGGGAGMGSRRMLFFAPWQGNTIIGTWYFHSREQAEQLRLSAAQWETCLKEIRATYPAAAVDPAEICFVHLGRVPALHTALPGPEPSIARHFRISGPGSGGVPQGYLSTMGVKYTTARDVAEKITRILAGRLGKNGRAVGLGVGGRVGGEGVGLTRTEPMGSYTDYLAAAKREARDIPESSLKHTIDTYGTDHRAVLNLVRQDADLKKRVPGTKAVLRAALAYSVRNEMAYRLSDLILRRSDIGSAARPADRTIQFTADLMARELGWDEKQRQKEIDDLLACYWW